MRQRLHNLHSPLPQNWQRSFSVGMKCKKEWEKRRKWDFDDAGHCFAETSARAQNSPQHGNGGFEGCQKSLQNQHL
jgi:hypothetical protein